MLPVICIMGPTAIGKTDLALEVYREINNIDIISVDSAMVYQGLNIGSGKPSKDILEQIPHGLVDIRKPNDVYSVADFFHDAKTLIKQSHANNRIPLLVGGTMMYFYALQNGLAQLPSSDSNIRAQLESELKDKGIASLYSKLQDCDPIAANRINLNDKQRIIRALEVFHITGQSMSGYLESSNGNNNSNEYNYRNIILTLENRSELHKRIEDRFYAMLNKGFVEEVELLFNNSAINYDLPAIRSCGYKQIWQYLLGNYTKDEMIEKSIVATRQLAKRQLTWLRQKQWVNCASYDIKMLNYQQKIINSLLSFDLFQSIV